MLEALGMLLVTVLILVLAWVVSRWVAKSGMPAGTRGTKAGERLSLTAQIPLGRNERVVLLRVGDTFLLLGVTQNSVTVLRELESGKVEEWLETDTPERSNFLELLQENLRKRK